MLRAIIFDFNGIILDDEPLHYESMRNVAASLGISLSREDYWNRYLPFDDKGCLDAICKDHSLQLSESQRAKALGDKSEFYHRMLQDRYPLFPGAVSCRCLDRQCYGHGPGDLRELPKERPPPSGHRLTTQ